MKSSLTGQNYIGNEWEQILNEQKKELAKAENELKQKIEHQKLRDYFAAKAMQSLIPVLQTGPVDTARNAYFMADAMMKAREQ